MWTSVKLTTPLSREEDCSWLMLEHGALGCEIELPKSPEASIIQLKASFRAADLSPERLCAINQALGELGIADKIELTVEAIPDEDWSTNWKQHFKPFTIGESFIISPPWLTDSLANDESNSRHRIIIDPGMAFGTGLHATTRYCLNAVARIDHFIPKMIGDSLPIHVVDVGTGSGILAIAAAFCLPNSKIYAIDNNENAVDNARRNIALNQLAERIKLIEGELIGKVVDELTDQVDLLFSNITCDDIVALLPTYKRLLKKRALVVCAGILNERVGILEAALMENGFEIVDRQIDGEWLGVILKKT